MPGSAFRSAAGSMSTWRKPGWLARRIFLGWCCRRRLLDRSQGRADCRVHDPGDRQRGAPDLAPRPTHLGLLRDDGVIRLVTVSKKLPEILRVWGRTPRCTSVWSDAGHHTVQGE